MKNEVKIPAIPILLILFFTIFSFPFIVTAKITIPTLEQNSGEKIIVDSLSKNSAQAKKHFQKGLEYSHAKKVDSAIQEYLKALELDPNLSMAHVNLGMSYILKKEFNDAIRELRKAINKMPKLKIAHFNLWWAYRQQQKYDQGIEELKKIIAIDPNDTNAYINLGDTYLADKKMILKAISAYSQGLTKNQKNVSLHQKLGKAYELKQQWDKAIHQFQQAVNQKKDDPASYLFLYVALKKTVKNSEAKKIIQKALSVSKNNPLFTANESVETLNILEYLAGTYPEKELLASKNPLTICQANYYIGISYLAAKNFKKATHYFQQAVVTNIFFISEYEYAKIELDQLKATTKDSLSQTQ